MQKVKVVHFAYTVLYDYIFFQTNLPCYEHNNIILQDNIYLVFVQQQVTQNIHQSFLNN
jgi:hypothetical protein